MRLAHPRSWLVPTLLLLAYGCSSPGCEGRSAPRGGSNAPSALEDDAHLRARLQAAVQAKGPGYVPRTRHHNPDGSPRYTNRLILETSPYLLQHAHNPVDWFPWGDEAFDRARQLGRPVFLSVGYSTCHWCHVMEEESFEDEDVARYLNEHYVCIKVDREERPDVDATYMTFVQALTGSGGWPMSVWLTPTREPFFGGTYFPPASRGARQGFLDVLRAQAERFTQDGAAVSAQASTFVERLRARMAPEPAGDFPSATLLDAATAAAARRFDPVNGGNRGAPKFPSSFPVQLLLRVARRTGDAEPRRMALTTLDRMRAGGLYDQIRGGFHRYSVDARWLVPHFEKMLYDNALLATAYLEAAQLTGDTRYAATTREVLDYLLREMRAADGTFYSATDADSMAPSGRRQEGYFFTWTPTELDSVLGADDARLARAWLGVSASGEVDGRSVLRVEREPTTVASDLHLDGATAPARAASIRSRLLEARSRRPSPLRDDKVIVAWNALTVSALARAAIVLGEPRYAEAATWASATLVAELEAHGPLPHVLSAGRPQGRAFADDAVLLAAALLDVFELTSDARWLDLARSLMDEVERDFADPTNGGYFLATSHHESLFLRDKPDHDGPVPSVNSVATLTWLRLYTFTDEGTYRARAETTVRAFSRTLAANPLALDYMLHALDWATDAAKEIVIVVPEGRGAMTSSARPLLDVLQRRFVPNSVLVIATEADIEGELGRRLPWVREKRTRDGRATAYVCERGACQLPTSDPQTLARQLSESRPYR